jgi:hypothetical protein
MCIRSRERRKVRKQEKSEKSPTETISSTGVQALPPFRPSRDHAAAQYLQLHKSRGEKIVRGGIMPYAGNKRGKDSKVDRVKNQKK